MRLIFYLISFIGGLNLLAFELLSSKLMTPIFGSTYHVWVITLFVTLLGIAIGYFLSSLTIISNLRNRSVLFFVIILNSLFFLLMPYYSFSVFELTINLNFYLGIFISVIILFLPMFTLFGTMSPLIIAVLSESNENVKNISPKIFTISTVGGVLGVYFFGFYYIPEMGIQDSFYLIDLLNIFSIVCFILSSKLNFLRSEN